MTRVLFFGLAADHLGRERTVDLPPEGATVGELRRRLSEGDEAAAAVLSRPDVRASVDQDIVRDEARILPGHEVAFFSIFSGG